MTKTETRIIRNIFLTGKFTATTRKQAETASRILGEILPHRIQCVDRTDEMGAFCQTFFHTDFIRA